jgi:hypothetical protein
MSPFVAPYRFAAGKRQALLQTLGDEGLGDAASRRLFVAALEYEIGAFRRAYPGLDPNTVPNDAAAAVPYPVAVEPAADTLELRSLQVAARGLLTALEAVAAPVDADLLTGLAAADRFARHYDSTYLDCLRAALGHLADACEPPPAPSREVAPAPTTETGRRFVALLAHSYTECFDRAPSSAADDPFARLVQAIARLTGVVVPNDAEIRRTLPSG